jgi:cytochrome b pre-mRNA-processing protein 3
MIFQRFFQPRPQVLAGRALFVSASEQARDPAFYAQGGVPDTPEGRFELYTLHVVLLLHRLKGENPQVSETRQGLFDAFVRNLDDGLREMGVGDLSVGKKMRKLGAAVYGRLKSYDDALTAGAAPEALSTLVARTLYADAPSAEGAQLLETYCLAVNAKLAAEPTDQFLRGEVQWPTFLS